MKKHLLSLILLGLFFVACSKEDNSEQQQIFTSEIKELKEFFQIPGLAVSITKNSNTIYSKYSGYADFDKKVVLDSAYVFPIASITKVFSTTLVMKLVEGKKLSLNNPINQYFTESKLSDSILVKHILAHTSEGDIGQKFHYSSRFGYLTKVIESASGMSFSDYMNETIIAPLKLNNTFLLKDSTQLANTNRKIAKPYFLDDGTEEGFIDFGYSSSAGLVSNLNDLSKFNKALDNNEIISQISKEKMYKAFNEGLPYGFGIFTQKFQGKNIVWAYGQYDCYSSLFLKIPSEDLTLTILANSRLLSDPPRLINGDITSSLFAISFLKNFVFNQSNMPLLEKDTISEKFNVKDNVLFRKKLLAQALAEAYMARFEPNKMEKSAALLERVFNDYPEYLEYTNLNLLHNLSFLKDVAFYMGLGEFNKFDIHIENIGQKLLSEDTRNPYANTYLGTYYARKGDSQKAKEYFEIITTNKNYSRNWYTQEAEQWLENNNKK